MLGSRQEEHKIFDFRFDWTPDLDIRLGEIDNYHKKIFRVGRDVEQLLRIQCMGVEEKQLIDITCELKDTMSQSFCEEENYMWRYEYSKMTAHREAHYRYRQELDSIDLILLRENPNKEVQHIKDIITRWTLEHMLTADKNMADAIRGQIHG
ncbi:MAG: hemerythrin family protein [Clostridium sp.]